MDPERLDPEVVSTSLSMLQLLLLNLDWSYPAEAYPQLFWILWIKNVSSIEMLKAKLDLSLFERNVV